MATGTSSHSARDRLLEAASEEVAAALGPGQVSLRAIARRAGLSHNAAEHHFQDRAGLLTALAVQGFDQLEGDLRGARRRCPDRRAPARRIGRRLSDVRTHRAQHLRAHVQSRPRTPARSRLGASQQRAFSVLEETAAKATGNVPAGREGDLPKIAWAFVHGLVGLARYGALRPTTAPPDPRQTEQIARDLMATFTSLLQAEDTRSSVPPVPDSRT